MEKDDSKMVRARYNNTIHIRTILGTLGDGVSEGLSVGDGPRKIEH